jgi:hypothetical protein
MLSLRLIAPNDYVVLEDGQPIGRIRLARERSPSIWRCAAMGDPVALPRINFFDRRRKESIF